MKLRGLTANTYGGYDTPLNDNARALSGGQRQRLALARALAAAAPILVLDEATSALEPELEERIVENLRTYPGTQIVIAHRHAAIRSADRIYVLDRGTIVQAGTHQELVVSSQLYRNLMLHAES